MAVKLRKKRAKKKKTKVCLVAAFKKKTSYTFLVEENPDAFGLQLANYLS